jgi:3-oxoacyl-[acyl-carrier protein] reductase
MDAGQLLDGRRVIVVGGGGMGNGRTIGQGVAAAGARVALIDINPDRVAEAVGDIDAAGGKALGLVGDVRVQADVERMVADAVSWLGGWIHWSRSSAGIRCSRRGLRWRRSAMTGGT